jgi:rubrerythrin
MAGGDGFQGKAGSNMAGIKVGQAVRDAIEAELAASRFYTLLAESAEDAQTRAFLEEMSRQEVGHARSIEKTGAALVDGLLPAQASGDLSGVETLPDWKFVDDIALTAAFEVALTAEQQASLYYDAIADFLEGEAREFFRSLSAAEDEHAKNLRERLARL